MSMHPESRPSAEGQRMLEALRLAVSKALERKRRLGQYAIIWQRGKPVRVGGEASRVAENGAPYSGEH